MIDLPILTSGTITSIERNYFGPTFNLTKEFLKKQIKEHTDTYHKLVNREIPPRSVVGTGYKNGRKVAETWLKEQITKDKYLLKHFDTKNQLTPTQINQGL